MIQFFLTRDLAKPLGKHLKPARLQASDLIWQADIAMIGTQPCVVAHEQQSNYIMVMCGLTETEFSNFPDYFAERFWREALAICMQVARHERPVLEKYLKALCQQQHFQLDPAPMEEGKISQTLEKLERLFLHEKEPLPESAREAFAFGVRINTRPRRSREQEPSLSPMDILGNICMTLIEERMAAEKQAMNPVITRENNIVRVDFAAHRRRG
jgi:hypothetical protein